MLEDGEALPRSLHGQATGQRRGGDNILFCFRGPVEGAAWSCCARLPELQSAHRAEVVWFNDRKRAVSVPLPSRATWASRSLAPAR